MELPHRWQGGKIGCKAVLPSAAVESKINGASVPIPHVSCLIGCLGLAFGPAAHQTPAAAAYISLSVMVLYEILMYGEMGILRKIASHEDLDS